MIYRVCEHYYNDEHYSIEDEVYEPQDCFVCFQIENYDELKPISLKNQHLFIKNCSCNGQIHNKCLEIWFKKNMKCPICRAEVKERIQIKNILLIISFKTNIVYLKFIKILKTLARISTLFMIFYTSIQYIYFVYLINHLNRGIYQNYSYIPYSGFDFSDNQIIKNITENN